MDKPFTAKMSFEGRTALALGASEQAGYITGQVLGIDSGFLAAGITHKNQVVNDSI